MWIWLFFQFNGCLDKIEVLHLDDNNDENFCSDSLAEEEPRVEEASAVPHPDDTGSAAPHSSDSVEDLDHPCDGTAAANIDDTGSAAEESAESHHEPRFSSGDTALGRDSSCHSQQSEEEEDVLGQGCKEC